jgi:hypothetical protein
LRRLPNPSPGSERTPCFRNIHISGITVRGAKQVGKFDGLEEMPLTEIVISDANMHAQTGLWMSQATDVEFHNCQVNTEEGPALYIKDAKNVDIAGFKSKSPHADTPVIDLRDVKNAFIRGCSAVAGTDVFLRVRGPETADVLLGENLLRRAGEPIDLGDDLPVGAVAEK